MKKFSAIITAILVVLLCVSGSFAGNSYPSPTKEFFANDFSNVLEQDTEDSINIIGKELENKTTAQVVAVTIDTLNDQEIEDYAVDLFEQWQIGQKDKDNGVLILVVVNDRRLRIEVGYGLEGALTDIAANEIITADMTPYLSRNNFDMGILEGYKSVAKAVAAEYGVSIDFDKVVAEAKGYQSSDSYTKKNYEAPSSNYNNNANQDSRSYGAYTGSRIMSNMITIIFILAILLLLFGGRGRRGPRGPIFWFFGGPRGPRGPRGPGGFGGPWGPGGFGRPRGPRGPGGFGGPRGPGGFGGGRSGGGFGGGGFGGSRGGGGRSGGGGSSGRF